MAVRKFSLLVVAAHAIQTLGSKECVAEPGEEDACSMRVELLQHQHQQAPAAGLSMDDRLSQATQMERLELAKPIAWIHVPKTGTSFADTIYHMRGVCPNFKDEWMIQPYAIPWEPDWGAKEEVCPGGFSPSYAAYMQVDTELHPELIHEGLGKYYEDNIGHIVSMFRQPEQRIISGYYNGGAADSVQIMWPYETPAASMREYAEVLAGCTVRTIMRNGPNVCGDPLPPIMEDEVWGAVSRLSEGFAFVGITDEWDTSMCLWHAMFGGTCQEFEFYNTRPGSERTDNTTLYDTRDLEGFVDMFDGPVYAEAQRIFEANLEYFRVDRSDCAYLCTFEPGKGP